jgi:hypothetical protein
MSASVTGVAGLYRDIASTLIIDVADVDQKASVEATGMHSITSNTIMSDLEVTTRLAHTVLNSRHHGGQS